MTRNRGVRGRGGGDGVDAANGIADELTGTFCAVGPADRGAAAGMMGTIVDMVATPARFGIGGREGTKGGGSANPG